MASEHGTIATPPPASATSAARAPVSPLTALRYPDYRTLWWGALASNHGNWIQTVAQGQLVYALSGSTAVLGWVAFATQIPMVCLTLIGGVLADRLERRKMLQVTQSVLTTTSLLLTLLTFTGQIQIWHILVLVAINGMMVGINIPTFQSFLGDLVPREIRGPAIALNSAQFHTSRSLGPVIAGLIFLTLHDPPGVYRSYALCFALNTLSFGALLGALHSIQYRPDHLEPLSTQWLLEVRRFREGIAEAWRYIKSSLPVTILLLLTALSAYYGMPLLALLPAYAAETITPFHSGASPGAIQSHLMTAAGAGSVVGALWGATRLQRIGPQLGIVISCVGYAVSNIALGQVVAEPAAWGWMVVNGFFATCNAVQINTRLQVRVPDDLRGRLMAVYSLCFTLAMALGNLASGYLARGEQVPQTLTLNGSVYLLVLGLVVLFGWRRWTRS